MVNSLKCTNGEPVTHLTRSSGEEGSEGSFHLINGWRVSINHLSRCFQCTEIIRIRGSSRDSPGKIVTEGFLGNSNWCVFEGMHFQLFCPTSRSD